MITGLVILGLLATAVLGFVGFVAICALVGATRAVQRMPEALQAAFNAPPTPAQYQQAARAFVLHCLATGATVHRLWFYDPDARGYRPAADATTIQAAARRYGQASILRWDTDLGQFDETTVTADMPVEEILG